MRKVIATVLVILFFVHFIFAFPEVVGRDLYAHNGNLTMDTWGNMLIHLAILGISGRLTSYLVPAITTGITGFGLVWAGQQLALHGGGLISVYEGALAPKEAVAPIFLHVGFMYLMMALLFIFLWLGSRKDTTQSGPEGRSAAPESNAESVDSSPSEQSAGFQTNLSFGEEEQRVPVDRQEPSRWKDILVTVIGVALGALFIWEVYVTYLI